MQTVKRTADEQYRLIMECRSSGLSDFQWCNEHGIKPGTFYNWVEYYVAAEPPVRRGEMNNLCSNEPPVR